MGIEKIFKKIQEKKEKAQGAYKTSSEKVKFSREWYKHSKKGLKKIHSLEEMEIFEEIRHPMLKTKTDKKKEKLQRKKKG
jgi:hypothetical protein